MSVAPGSGLPASKIPGLVLLDAVELSWLISRREVSCVEVMQTYLAHIDRFNPQVNAIVSRREEAELLDEARRRDQELDRGEHRGWMHGFPIAVKDLSDAAGLPTTMGSPLFADSIADRDELHVQRMREAGAIVIGKTNVPEFGLGSHTFNPVFGTTRNPYDTTRSAGGSSGGAGAALALRLLPVADGSDFMGSLRNPAAWNNIVSLRPSFGRIPAEGFLSSPSVVGPMGRTVRDVAMLLSTMAGPDERAPLSIEQDPELFAGRLDHDFDGVRIGWVGDFDGHLATEPGLLELCAESFAAFGEIGCAVEPVAKPLPVEQAWETFLLWRSWTVGRKHAELYDDPAKRALLKPELIFEIENYHRLQVPDISRALSGRDEWHAAVSALFDEYDFLLAPSAQVFPFDAEQRWPHEIGGRSMDTYHRWMEAVAPWTLSGHPVANLPVGCNEAGLPMGVQLIGRNHAEWSLLQLAHAYERATDWPHRILPPLLR
ncbi:amidase [Saccharopolyspora kobensis]|uniref:Amidase n=1 Tax=Saccharopolyspora kobensis TaxID=146035 RepID=A0A1H6DR84_9PSEU|nr:amidase [Saccharopolyspora kobensis]SEG87779.1 amidase [Saccharopolyspora kobensis]SFE05074.1 amidase [Saccharopolyspora kobensis]